MAKYFRGCWRKIGGLTLVLALLFMVGWIRSVVVEDSLTAQCDGLITIYLGSKNQGLVWARLQETKGPQHPLFARYRLGWRSQKITKGPFDGIEEYATQSRWNWCGFRFEEGDLELPVKIRLTVRVIPYWSIVLPLTLLSIGLLLIKPREGESAVNSPESSMRP